MCDSPVSLVTRCYQLVSNLSQQLETSIANATCEQTCCNLCFYACWKLADNADKLKAAFHFRVFHTHVYARKTLNRLKH